MSSESDEFSPWFSGQEDEQTSQEDFPNYDKVKNESQDLTLKFRLEVLDKYRNHEFCRLETGDSIHYALAFLTYEKMEVCRVLFQVLGNIVSVGSEDFVFVPPKERKHWKSHHIVDKTNETL